MKRATTSVEANCKSELGRCDGAEANDRKRATKNDPKLVAFARELRDRWQEQLITHPLIGCGKYDVVKQIEAQPRVVEARLIETSAPKLLAA